MSSWFSSFATSPLRFGDEDEEACKDGFSSISLFTW